MKKHINKGISKLFKIIPALGVGIIFMAGSLLTLSCSSSGDSSPLDEVDRALTEVDQYQKKALINADSLGQEALMEKDSHLKIKKLLASADAYKSLDLQKALLQLKTAYSFTKTTDSPEDSINVLMDMASLYNSEGLMLKEACDIYKIISTANIPDNLKLRFFILGVQINKNLADRAFDDDLKDYYSSQASGLRDSVLMLDPESVIIAANKLVENGQYRDALNLMFASVPEEAPGSRKGPYYHYIAGLYRQLEMPDSQLFYLAKASADDLRSGVREYIALTELAQMLESSHIVKAYSYIEQSLRDARASHSSLRQREVVPIFNNIDHAYKERQKRLTASVIILSITLFVIIIGVAGAAIVLRKKNKLLFRQGKEIESSRDMLDISNKALERSNKMLAEESRVKSYYIHSFMELCLEYIAKMESFRAKLGKIASSGDINKVTKAINSSRYVNEEINEFYDNFDKSFLSLYPEFFQTLNNLLKPDLQYREVSSLSTELRLYALIWLGITSSGEIARFLRCSESTVYNYRTQMRNKALKRENFEADFIAAASTF